MSMEFPLSQSQRTQSFQMPQAPEDERDAFVSGFSELAYRAFQKSQPELMGSVLTFRVLDVDVEEGRGIGTFIVQYEQDIVFVPCVVSDNAVKPLDMFYSRTADRFYPFTTSWLQESTKGGVNQLGRGVKPPKSMPTDVDIRNLVVPPTTGRYSYAADVSEGAWLPFVVALKKEASAEAPANPQFLNVLDRAPDHVKTAFIRMLERKPKIAKLFGEFYGAKKIAAVLTRRTKTAQTHRVEVPMKHDVFIMTTATPVHQIKEKLPPTEAALAYQSIRTTGFYVKDTRRSTDDLLTFAETDLRLTQPTSPGVYNVYMANGDMERCIIVPNPMNIHRHRSDEARFPRGYYQDDRNRPKGLKLQRGFLVLFPDGRYTVMDDMVAEAVIDVAHSDVERFVSSMTKDAPGNGQQGVLISAANMDIRATQPMFAQNVVDADGRITFEGEFHHTVIINKRLSGNGVIYPQDQDTLMFAASFRWFPLKKMLNNSQILSSPTSVLTSIEHRLEKKGAQRVRVKKAGREFVVGNDRTTVHGVKAVEKIANTYNLTVKEASEIVSIVGAGVPVSMWRMKRAQGETLDPNAPPQPDPNAMPQGPPPGPSGLDLATNEKLQQIAGQIAALQQMQQILTEVQQRAQMIDQGGGAMAAPAAAAGMMAGPGTMSGQPPMVPAPMGGAPAPAPAPPAGAAPQGAVPAGGGMMPAGAPQPPQQPVPPPVMPEEEPSPQNLEQQVNPDFIQSAAGLQDQGIFDATAIASLAKQKGVRELIQNHTPALEKAMDDAGRILLLLYIKEIEVKQQIGSEAYEETEQRVRDVFKGLGDSVLSLNRYSDQMASGAGRRI